MHISLTRLQLRRYRFLPAFIGQNARVIAQLKKSSGFLGGKVGVESARAYWTMTAWKDDASMKDFRNTKAHLAAMPKLLEWCDEASVAAKTLSDSAGLPAWEDAYAVMRDYGRTSPVRHPTDCQLAGKTAPEVPHFYHAFTQPIK